MWQKNKWKYNKLVFQAFLNEPRNFLILLNNALHNKFKKFLHWHHLKRMTWELVQKGSLWQIPWRKFYQCQKEILWLFLNHKRCVVRIWWLTYWFPRLLLNNFLVCAVQGLEFRSYGANDSLFDIHQRYGPNLFLENDFIISWMSFTIIWIAFESLVFVSGVPGQHIRSKIKLISNLVIKNLNIKDMNLFF